MDDEAVLWDSDLEEFLSQAVQQPSSQAACDGRIHLLLGDSIARDAPVCVSPPDLLLRLEKGGHTWARLVDIIDENIDMWRRAASDYNRPLGRAMVWMTGNDVYPRHGSRVTGLDIEQLRRNATDVVRALRAVAQEVVILGPLPRFKFDINKTWTQTPAFHAERCLKHSFCDDAGVSVENLGRALTTTRGKCKALAPSVGSNFASDGIHLSDRGYEKVLNKIPSWLTWVSSTDEDE